MPVRAILFDLGNVLIDIDIDFTRTLAHWAEHSGVDAGLIRERFAVDDTYRAYEKGEIELEAYFARLREQLGLALTDAQMLAGWNAIFVGQRHGVAALLGKAAAKYPLYVFSNTNRAHEIYWSREYAPMLAHFREVFVSSTLGMRKPAREAFEHVAREMGERPEDIIFLDDLQENIDGAKAVGFQTVHVISAGDVEAAITRLL